MDENRLKSKAKGGFENGRAGRGGGRESRHLFQELEDSALRILRRCDCEVNAILMHA